MLVSLSKSEWNHWCNEFGESHQTKISFCRDNILNYHQFLYWLEKYNKTSAKLIPVKAADPKQPLVPEKSSIAKAINYTLPHRDGLT